MNGVLAILAGAGVGLASFGGLWLTVQLVSPRPPVASTLGAEESRRLCPATRLLLAGSSLARLALITVAFAALAQEGPGTLLAGLAGLWLCAGA